jgi:hypothetical protein
VRHIEFPRLERHQAHVVVLRHNLGRACRSRLGAGGALAGAPTQQRQEADAQPGQQAPTGAKPFHRIRHCRSFPGCHHGNLA